MDPVRSRIRRSARGQPVARETRHAARAPSLHAPARHRTPVGGTGRGPTGAAPATHRHRRSLPRAASSPLLPGDLRLSAWRSPECRVDLQPHPLAAAVAEADRRGRRGRHLCGAPHRGAFCSKADGVTRGYPTTRTLAGRLRRMLGCDGFRGEAVQIVERFPDERSSSFRSEVVTVRLGSGETLTLLCKYSPPDRRHPPTWHTANGHRHGVAYEGRVYRQGLEPPRRRTPPRWGTQ